jgi:uncharacterized surface protein with fasciclin (FAS1) repeats
LSSIPILPLVYFTRLWRKQNTGGVLDVEMEKNMNARYFVAVLAALSVGIPSAVVMAGTKKSTAAAKSDIVDTALSNGQFNTLVAALQAAGLTETLKGAGPFTVFAPTDEAFKKLPAGTLDALLKPENKQQLVEVLTYHVIAGKVMARDVKGKTATPTTIEGDALAIDGTKKGVMVDNAAVTSADVRASNGVIHVIDTVLLPKSLTAAAPPAAEPAAGSAPMTPTDPQAMPAPATPPADPAATPEAPPKPKN